MFILMLNENISSFYLTFCHFIRIYSIFLFILSLFTNLVISYLKILNKSYKFYRKKNSKENCFNKRKSKWKHLNFIPWTWRHKHLEMCNLSFNSHHWARPIKLLCQNSVFNSSFSRNVNFALKPEKFWIAFLGFERRVYSLCEMYC